MPYIALEGNIGAGKSTLLHRLGEELGWEVLEEGIEFDETFQSLLKLRYDDPSRDNVANLQIYIAQFMGERINNLDPDKYYLVERSVMACQLFSLAADRPDIIDAIAGHVLKVNPPEFYLYLTASPENCLDRIIQRDRDGENNIDIDYLRKLHGIHENWYGVLSSVGRAYQIDSNGHPNVVNLAANIRQRIFAH